MSAGWAPYNEKNPYGKGSISITAGNVAASRIRRADYDAVQKGTATPEQVERHFKNVADHDALAAQRGKDTTEGL